MGRRRLELPPGRYETVLPPGAVADLMIYLYWSSGARNAHDGRTVLSAGGGGTRVGERLWSCDDPAQRSGLPRAGVRAVRRWPPNRARDRPSFDNGTRSAPTEWISNGTLRALLALGTPRP